jgi:hypothetical protein
LKNSGKSQQEPSARADDQLFDNRSARQLDGQEDESGDILGLNHADTDGLFGNHRATGNNGFSMSPG